MKVKDLIELLKQQDPEAEVVVFKQISSSVGEYEFATGIENVAPNNVAIVCG